MDDQIRLRLHRPADVLAYLPYRFGFVPRRSLVVLSVVGETGGPMLLGTAARLDLDDLDDPEVMLAASEGLTTQLLHDGASWAFTVLYTDEPFEVVRAGLGPAGRVLARWLELFVLSEPSATLLVSPHAFCCLECAEQPCCPDDGHPVEILAETTVAAGMVLAGQVIAGSRDELACPREVDPGRAAHAAAAATREREAMRSRSPSAAGAWRRRALDAVGRSLSTIADGGVIAPSVLGRLGVALQDAELRDVVVAWVLGGTRQPLRSLAVATTLSDALTGDLTLPSQQHHHAAAVLLTEMVRHAGPGDAAHALALRGWLAWWFGDGARADVVLTQALTDNPGCGLARLLDDVLTHGLRPGWAHPDRYASPRAG